MGPWMTLLLGDVADRGDEQVDIGAPTLRATGHGEGGLICATEGGESVSTFHAGKVFGLLVLGHT